MSRDRKAIGPAPTFLTCDPQARSFPSGWKDTWFRRMALPDATGETAYECPLCARWFSHDQIDYLHGDHIWPYSLFGETSWENYQMICGSCNAAKGNRVAGEIRKILGEGAFRQRVAKFLSERLSADQLEQDAALQQMLADYR